MFLTALFLVTAPGFGQSGTDTLDIRRQILSVLKNQCSAWNKGDIDNYMEGYWRSDSLIFTSGGNVELGWESTLEKYKKSYGTKIKMGTLVFSDLQIELLSPESAWVIGRWKLQRVNDAPEGIFTLIFRKFNAGWKIIHDHTSLRK